MTEKEEISETLGFKSTLKWLMARQQHFSTILHTEFVGIMIYISVPKFHVPSSSA
jgi:hypothetical protein